MNVSTDFYEDEKFERLKKLERTKRQRVVTSVVTALIGLPLILYAILNNAYATKVDSDLPGYFAIGLLFSGAGILHTIFWYLQTGFRDQLNIDAAEAEIFEYRPYSPSNTNGDVEELKAELNKLKTAMIPGTSSELTEELIEKIKNDAHQGLLSELNEKLNSNNLNASIIEEIKSARKDSTIRIKMEIDALARRGNFNLIAGVGVAMIGIGTLSSFIFPESIGFLNFLTSYNPEHTLKSPESQLDQSLKYATRTALIISIEILAFFFLRIYKSNLEGMKYFQNELTNLESKYISLITSAHLERPDTTHKVLLNFVETERNHILEKGQSTTELKKIELEKNQFVEITKALATITPKTK
ncbi:hypothetical protein [Pseudomonas simiae]|uniref:hypothetical protein n=1 Tax=Pseudomonas simiae TaxID=321846 RepID=UPI0011B2035C|nr:hypothetical protein [Pseudomonas simiae]